MVRVAGVACKVYHGDAFLGDAEVFPVHKDRPFPFPTPNNEIRITHFSPPSDRCPPLSILQTVSPFSVLCKVQAKSLNDHALHRLYLSCFSEFKSAVVVVGNKELHLVAMPSKVENVSCFWCCSVEAGLYASCLGMLNLRCLAIVFDLDETLIVANTMKSFEDRIELLSRKIDAEDDIARVSGMSAEIKRYIEDKELLKQYIENDSVMDNGRLVAAQSEEVQLFQGNQGRFVRRVVRLPEKNIVLTRINPENRDTSVFVRLRPAWEDLRSYLTAKGRKRFEVYVCTMAERDYALEMWRLLDPESHLISPKQLIDRVVCVKSGTRKSLQHVFQDGLCHPKMAMVIDDRLQVWDDKDQPRVHVVPAFSPYYAPQAETATVVPVLCVARNVACNVRGGFFKEFDENLLRRIFELNYENDISDLPHAPDVSNYLISEDTSVAVNNIRDAPISEGLNGVETERLTNRPEPLVDEQKTNRQAQPDNSFLGVKTANANEPVQTYVPAPSTFIPVLQEIGRRSASKIEFRDSNSLKDLQFSAEVLFNSEIIGIGVGRNTKEAQMHAAENALHNLANNYLSFMTNISASTDRKTDEPLVNKENGFLSEASDPQDELTKNRDLIAASTTEHPNQSKTLERLSSVLSSIEELCLEGQSIVFKDKGSAMPVLNEGEYYFQIELAGKLVGKGIASTSEEAKLLAAEESLQRLRTGVNL